MIPLKDKVKQDRLSPFCHFAGAKRETVKRQLGLNIDESGTSYEMGREKEYVFTDTLDFSEQYSMILDVDVKDYGAEIETESLERRLDENHSRPMNLDLDILKNYNSEVRLTGSFLADAGHVESLGMGVFVLLEVVAVAKKTVIPIYIDLFIEGFLLESVRPKLAFFSYFTALESFISSYIDTYKATVHSELDYQIEHLPLKDKLRIACKEVHGNSFEALPVWGELMSTFNKTNTKRNEIAHARAAVDISEEDMFDVYFAFLLAYGALEKKLKTFSDIEKMFYPRNKKKV